MKLGLRSLILIGSCIMRSRFVDHLSKVLTGTLLVLAKESI